MSFSKDTYWHISTALNPDKYGIIGIITIPPPLEKPLSRTPTSSYQVATHLHALHPIIIISLSVYYKGQK